MANVDRPDGFRFVKTLSGQPVNALIRTIGVADGEDIFVGDFLNLESGLADPAATNDAALLGVAVGFGKKNDMSQEAGDIIATDLNVLYYDDSAHTHTDVVVHYIPAWDAVFEVQTATALSLAIGDTCDLADATGDATSGRSRQEITTSSNADFTVVGKVNRPDNDETLVNGRYQVMVTNAEQAFK